MDDGEDWLMRPVVEGMCQYESLFNCSLSMADIARMNAALDVKVENENRRQKAND